MTKTVQDLLDLIKEVDPEQIMIHKATIDSTIWNATSEGHRIFHEKQQAKKVKSSKEKRDAAEAAKKEREARVLKWCRAHLKKGDIVRIGGTYGHREIDDFYLDKFIRGFQIVPSKIWDAEKCRFVTDPKRPWKRTHEYTTNHMGKIIEVQIDGKMMNVNKMAKGDYE